MARSLTTSSRADDPHQRVVRRDEAASADSRLFLVIAGVVIAALSSSVAVLSALVSRMIWRPDLVAIPWGLGLAVAASVMVVLVSRMLGRRLAFVAAGTWIIATGLVLAGRPEGDYVFAQDGLGLGYLLVCTIGVISAAGAGGPPR